MLKKKREGKNVKRGGGKVQIYVQYMVKMTWSRKKSIRPLNRMIMC